MEKQQSTMNSQATEMLECSKCHKKVAPQNGQNVKGKFVCNDCIAKSKRNMRVAMGALLACCVAGGGIWFYMAQTDRQLKASGFDGVSSINDTVRVEMDSINVVFNLATAVITSTPVSTQAPISNIEDFKRVVAQNVDAAQTGSTNTLYIPVSAVQFGFQSAELSPAAKSLISEIATLYNQTSKENNIVIEGYACNIGENAPNDYISHQRADAVKAAFIDSGVDANKLTTKWYGKTRNSEFNLPNNEDNRRVLISIR